MPEGLHLSAKFFPEHIVRTTVAHRQPQLKTLRNRSANGLHLLFYSPGRLPSVERQHGRGYSNLLPSWTGLFTTFTAILHATMWGCGEVNTTLCCNQQRPIHMAEKLECCDLARVRA